MSGRTNFVQVSNLPPYFSNGLELLNAFSSCGQVQVRQIINQTEIPFFVRNAICPGYHCSQSHNRDRVLCYEVNSSVKNWCILILGISRSQSDYAVFALNNTSIGGSNVLVSKFFLNAYPPNIPITAAYMKLGQYIGQDHHLMDANSFVPWSPAMSAPGGSAQNCNMRQALTEPWAGLRAREAGPSALY